MYKNIVILYMLGHVLGEFYFQDIIEIKNEGYKKVVKRNSMYFLGILIISIPVINLKIAMCSTGVVLSHMLIDSIRCLCVRKHSYKEKYVFLTEQILYIVVIMIFVYIAIKYELKITVLDFINDYFGVSGISKIGLVRWTLVLLVLHKPANIFIQKMIGDYKPEGGKGQFEIDHNIGRHIGTIERWIMILLLSVNQYAAMGFVLTAKSIARYDKISKEKKFAEYYLLGTLMSTMMVIVSAICLL